MDYKEKKQYRLPGYNYAQNGFYFVTICTKDHEMFFGNIINAQMMLSDIGKIVNKYWLEIPRHFPHVKLHEYIIMPNHVYGILEIDWDGTRGSFDPNSVVGTQNFVFLRDASHNYENKFGPQSKNLSSIIRGYKMAVKKWAAMNNIDFAWQPRFRDTIIRNEESLYKIRRYIIYNPLNWELDRNNSDLT